MSVPARVTGLSWRWQGLVALLACVTMVGVASAQTNPTAQAIPFTLDFRTLAASSTTYPAGWQGWTNGTVSAAYLTTGPTADLALTASSSASTTAGGVHNYNGKIGTLNSGTNDNGLCLAVNTTGSSGVVVSYEVMTIRNPYDGTTNTRILENSLQYRVGTAGAWTTLAGTAYQNNTTLQTGSGVVTPQKLEYRSATLPAACDNQAVVQLRWAQREVSGVGSRPSFAVDNLAVQQPAAGGQATALQFDGVNDYVTFGQAPGLGASTFTIETWFRRTGTGVTTSTGSGGITAIVPLVAKGFAEADGSTADMNYLLGINTAGNVIAVDYEEGTGQTSPGLNHPLSGTTAIALNTWYHAAATFDGTTLRLYLNGLLDGTLVVGANRLPQSASIQHATLGTALNSTGGIGTQTLGLFQGQLDEARIWSAARTACEISGAMNSELTSGAGLLGRWGMHDGAGSVLSNSLSTPNGILMNGPTWVTGSPFDAPLPTLGAPTGLLASAPDGVQVSLTWTDNATGETAYEVERSTSGVGGPYTLLATLPANSTSFIDAPLSASSQFCYQVRAISTCVNSAYATAACATTTAELCNALQFDPDGAGTDSYATFGNPAALQLANLTIEMWMRRDGPGVGTNTGTGGIPDIIPLLSKGRAEAEAAAQDINYIFGIRASDGVLAADFEEGPTGASPSLNHPVVGTTPIGTGTWHHVAATYDGTTWKLYLDGLQQASLTVGQPLGSASTVAVALASALTSANAPSGFFDGAVDEVRVWNVARTQTQIQTDINSQITSPQSGLVARWAMNEGSGTAVYGTAGTAIHGTIVGSAGTNWTRSACAPFNLSFTPPAPPTGLGAVAVTFSRVDLTWTDASDNETGFEIERSTTGAGGTYSPLITVAVNSTSYSNTGLTTNSEYCYRVRAVNDFGGSADAGPACATTPGSALDFGAAASTYVTFGDPAELDLAQFTLECWFRRDGTGTSTSTGSNGVTAIPLLTHGAQEADASNVDMNFFLGIRASDGVLCADFEEGAAGATPGSNHPVAGITPVGSGWHHAAATYDGTTWKLYLDGTLEATLAVGQPVQSGSVQHAALATALNSTGAANGFFDGVLDEARVWSVVRTPSEIQAAANTPITTPTAALVARWGLDEGTGTAVNGSAGTTVNGTITGANYTWAASAPFNLSFTPPDPPSGLAAVAVTHTQINLSWSDLSTNESGFEIQRSTTGVGGTYSPLVTVPASTIAYSDIGLAPSSEYCYRVRAVNGSGSSSFAGPTCATTPATSNTALDFAGTTALPNYASFGSPASLQLTAFTIEMWLRRDGAGEGTNTGTGGIADAIPLVAKGRADAETAAADINYLFGVRAATGTLCADFEEGAAGASPSLNHPIEGVTPVALGTWYHAAATYDGVTWKLYLNGNLDASLPIGQPLASASTVAVSLASALTSANAPAGFFNGAVDEVRIWNLARDQAQIQSTANVQLSTATPGLVARWSLDEGSGSTIAASAGTSVSGTITGSAHTWTSPGAPFNLSFNQQPNSPVLVAPANGATGVPTSPTLQVSVSDPDGTPLTVTYYGRPVVASPGPDFTVIGLPDTQYYTGQLNGGTNAIFQSQTNWMVANRVSRNIVYVGGLGDCVENGDNSGNNIEWQRADASLSILENPLTTGLTDGIPYGVSVGNHDQSPIGNADGTTTFYNQFFGSARFTGRTYYGGHYGSNNDNWYETFSASGMDFIVISFEYDTSPDPAILAWADNLLATNPTRRAIILSHFIINTGNPGGYGPQGQAIYDALKARGNLDVMLCGHVPGEGRRQDTFSGNTVHTMLSDYQSRTAGGNGWLRILEFSPANNEIRVKTYSPWLDQFENDGDSQFTLPYDMHSAPAFSVIGTASGVPSGSTSNMAWSGLSPGTAYEWYATVSDGSATTVGTTAAFTTAATATHTITATAGPNGTISPSGAVTVASGADQLFTFTPAANHHVSQVTVDASPAALAPSYNFTNVTANHSIDVQFAIDTYTLTYLAAANGSITGTTPQTVNHGDNGTAVTAVPDAGYHFMSWSDGVLTAARTDLNVTANLTVTATFGLNQYTLNYLASSNGTLTGTTTQTVNHGSSGTAVTAVPNAGYHFLSWSDGVLTAARTDTNVMADLTVTASFEVDAPVSTSTVSVGAASGLITLGNPIRTVPVTISRTDLTPMLAFSVVFSVSPSLEVSGGSGGIHEGTYLSIVNPTTSFNVIDKGVDGFGNHSYQADGTTLGAPCGATAASGTLFTIDLSSPASSGSGTVTVTSVMLRDCSNADLPWAIGSSSSLSIDQSAPTVSMTSPNGGESWYVGSSHNITWTATDAEGITSVDLAYSTNGGVSYPNAIATVPGAATSYAWTIPATPGTTVRVRATAHDTNGNTGPDASDANFTISYYTLSYLAGAGGTISGPTTQLLSHGANGTAVTAVPSAGYHFVGWSDGVSTASRTDISVMADLTVTASFAINQYTLTYLAGANGSISGTTPQTVNHGGSGTSVTAVADAGYHFTSWSDGVLTATRTDTNVMADLTVTASFAINQYTLTYLAGAYGFISGTTSQTVNHGGNGAAVNAVADAGYHFVSWSDGVLTATRTDTNVMADLMVTASFVVNPPVAAVANLVAAQVRPGTLGSHTTPIHLSWNATPPGTTVEVWRKGFGSYPDYDDAGGALPTASSSYPPGAGWVKVTGLTSPGDDLVGTRDFYYYVAYAQDGFGTWSPASAMTSGTLNYHLGDVSNGIVLATGNNKVFGEDISLLGTNYGLTNAAMASVNYLDVGPTTTAYVDGRPLTDDRIDFEDLVMFAINYGLGAAGPALAPVASGTGTVASDAVLLEAPARGTPGQTLTARLSLRATGALLALSTRLSWDPAVVEPVDQATGEWWASRGGQTFSAKPGTVDAAALAGRGVAGEGELAVVRFRVVAAGDPRLQIA